MAQQTRTDIFRYIENFFSVRNAKQWLPVEYLLAIFTFKGLMCKNVLCVLDE